MDIRKNASFCKDHRKFAEGLYISGTDGDITTYDMRMRKPNGGDYIDNTAMHTFEHMFSTYIRNNAENVIYFGPMGCQTGFYLLIRNSNDDETAEKIKLCCRKIIEHTGPVFGASEPECGNYKNLNLDSAKKEAERYLKILNEKKIDFKYYEED